MWVKLGVVEVGVQALDKERRLDVLELLGYLMHLIPSEVQLVHEKHFPKAVLADGLQSKSHAEGSDLQAVIFSVLDDLFFAKLAEHVAYRCGLGLDGGSDVIGRHAFFSFLGKVVNGF